MAESSLFAQRLQAIMERRRLQERILATRRELEEERLRAQRLKRKSLRDRWLMEGTSTPTDDNDHISSAWEAQSRIQELEQDLSSLQSQMELLDNPGCPQGRQQPEESVKVLKEAMLASPGDAREVNENPPCSPSGRNCNEPRLELAPVPPKRPVRVAAQEKLQNGDMAGLGLFGNEYSTDKVEVKRSPEDEAGVDLQDYQGSSEVTSGEKPACHGLEHSEAPSSSQGKLTVEEMVIRDHLGQEVGSMDAVGQTQRSIGKNDQLEDYTDLGNGCEEENRPSSLCNVSCQEEVSTTNKGQLDDELGSRDGPEGESPTSQDHQSPSKPLQDEHSNHYTFKHGTDEELEMGSLTEEATLMSLEVKQLLDQGAKEAVGNAEPEKYGAKNLTGVKRLQESLGPEAMVLVRGEERQEQVQPCPSGEAPVAQETTFPNPPEEARICLVDQATSASLAAQDPISSLQDTKETLLDQIPSSFEEAKGPLLDPVISSLPNQSLPNVLEQTPPLQERKESLPASNPFSSQEPLLDSNPPTSLSSSTEQKPSSLQGEASAPQEEFQSLLDQVPSPVQEANGKQLAQSASLPDQAQSSLPDHLTALPEQNHSPTHEAERSLQITAALQDQEHSVLETKGLLPGTTPSLTDRVSSLPNQITSSQGVGELSSEKITVVLQNQMPIPPEAQILSLPESDVFLPGHILSSVDEDKLVLPEKAETSVPEPSAPPMQDQKPTFLGDENPASQELGGSLADQTEASLPNQTSPNLEAKGLPQDPAQPPVLEQLPVSLEGQAPSLQGTEEPLPEQQNLPATPEETPRLQDQITTPNKANSSASQDMTTAADDLPSSNQDSVQPLLEKTSMEENQKLIESGDTSLTSATAVVTEEATEVLENLPAEQQPLLKEPTTSVAPLEISVGDAQLKTGISKPHVATSQEAPTYTTTSANTASSCPLPPAVPHQVDGQEQGQNRRKQKSCQCCSVM